MHDTKQFMAMKYAFVTNRVLRAISCLRSGRSLAPDAIESFDLAAKLLLEMRRGAALVAGSTVQLGYSAESIPAAARALGVIERLSLASRASQVHTLLESFDSNLQILARGSKLEAAKLDALEQFIRALNQSLTEEVTQATLGKALEKPENVGP
jgi:hypothetical protein